MRLLSVHVEVFRNIAQATLDPSLRVTILVGENGQGKTNLLEALYFACTLSHDRGARDGRWLRLDY